jgi:dTDP-4-dehydrorhamnose 3,5-epimerase
VRVTRGAIYDVLLDVRADSPTFGRWQAFELSADNRCALYVPEGLAHGFQTLSDDTDVFYQMGAFYHPQAARGIRWDDPRFAIAWPGAERIISERDRSYALWQETGRESV